MRGISLKSAMPLLAVALLAACHEQAAPPAPTLEQKLLSDLTPEREFNGELHGQALHLIVSDCKVYLNEADPESTSGARRWTVVLKPEFYPSLMSCQRQQLSRQGDTVEAVIGETAMGAGGCCTTGGRFRSTDGREWKKQ